MIKSLLYTYLKRTAFLIVAMMVTLPLLSQEEMIRKEVRVVKPYEPILEKASKINMLPVLNDTVHFQPDFKYSITPHPFLAPYEARQIKPARLEGESIAKLYKSYLRLGIGNYLSPVGEFSMNNLRSKDHNIGLYLSHESSQGKVKLENDKRVPAGYADTKGEVYGQKYFSHATLEGKASIHSSMVHRYGYFPQLDTTLVTDSIRQSYLIPGISARLHSSWPDSGHLNYDIRTGYQYFTDKVGNIQHAVRFKGDVGQQFDDKTLGLTSNIKYFRRNLGLDSVTNTVVSLQPWYHQHTSEWNLMAALDATFDARNGNTEVRLYPKIRFQFNIVPDYLTAYLGMDGGLKTNDLQSMTLENPYLTPGTVTLNTDRKMEIYGSLFGQAGRESDYRLFGSFALADQMPFFVNDSVNTLGNQFTVVYDDVQILKLSGEYTYRLGEKWMVGTKAAIYRYTMSSETKPWYKPGFEASLHIAYNLRNKVLAQTDLFYIGSRYAKSLLQPSQVITLPAYPDINLKIEYRYTKLISFYLQFNNMAGIRYQEWNQYPSQGFRVTGGFTYSL